MQTRRRRKKKVPLIWPLIKKGHAGIINHSIYFIYTGYGLKGVWALRQFKAWKYNYQKYLLALGSNKWIQFSMKNYNYSGQSVANANM